jgi:hypothetical protein
MWNGSETNIVSYFLSNRFPGTINFHLRVQIFQNYKPIWDLNAKLLFTLYSV